MKRNYNDPLYKQWRQSIRKRDNHICQWPHCVNKNKLHVHHICRWADNPGLRYHINNGITLCKDHHKLISNNEDSYIEFFTKLILAKNRD